MQNRFERQIILKGFGDAGQDKLQKARVLVVGAGGLGCPILLYLAAMGVGTLGIVDGDTIDETNLNRQVTYGMGDIGMPKAETAGLHVMNKYTDIKVNAYNQHLTRHNCHKIISEYDVVIDGTDNFPSRYLINDACVMLNKPLVFGAIYQYEGQVAVFNLNGSTNYRDVHPEINELNVPNCTQNGVLGVLAGIIGTMMANETIKIISGIGKPLVNKVLYYNMLNNKSYEVAISPQTKLGSVSFMTNQSFCTKNLKKSNEISWQEAFEYLNGEPSESVLVDVREPNEMPKIENLGVIILPLSQLDTTYEQLNKEKNILIFCQAGFRSQRAVEKLNRVLTNKNIFSISGGLAHPLSPVKQSELCTTTTV